MNAQTAIKLKFLVPADARAGVAAELARAKASLDRTSLTAMYLDTADGRLARAGLSWRLRREGRRWIQTLSAAAGTAVQRLHEQIRPDASPDASAHAGTPLGDELAAVLRRAGAHGLAPEVRFRTELRRMARRTRSRGALVAVAFDEGRITSADAGVGERIPESEFELLSGSLAAMLALAERWRKRFGLLHEPRSVAERGTRLAEGLPSPPVRKAGRPAYTREAPATEAYGQVLDECLAQITLNAAGLTAGDAALRVDHVHQLRVGIRRLRTALRLFEGWVPAAPDEFVAGLRALFATLGTARDNDVLGSGVAVELAAAGAPPMPRPPAAEGVDPADAVRAAETQRTLLAWIGWRAALLPAARAAEPSPAPGVEHAQDASAQTPAAAGGEPTSVAAAPSPDVDAPSFHRHLARRLRRWHARIAADWKSFDELGEEGLHALRKRIKRQRYALEFAAPLLRRRQLDRYLDHLASVQERMGALNDLFVARTRFQELAENDPATWFALGWLAARIAEMRASIKPALARLARSDPPAP